MDWADATIPKNTECNLKVGWPLLYSWPMVTWDGIWETGQIRMEGLGWGGLHKRNKRKEQTCWWSDLSRRFPHHPPPPTLHSLPLPFFLSTAVLMKQLNQIPRHWEGPGEVWGQLKRKGWSCAFDRTTSFAFWFFPFTFTWALFHYKPCCICAGNSLCLQSFRGSDWFNWPHWYFIISSSTTQFNVFLSLWI